jgi:hypothetical protein
MKNTVFFLLLFLSACGNRQQPASADNSTFSADTVTNKFFPIADFLVSEIRNVDSMSIAVLKCKTVGRKTDTTFLTGNEFNREALVFLSPELAADSLEKNYTENSFSDKTTGYLTFTYSPKDKGRSPQRIDVMIAPASNGKNKVKSIYMERSDRLSDTLVIRKMYWQAGRNFEVVTSTQLVGKPAVMSQLHVVWNEDTD